MVLPALIALTSSMTMRPMHAEISKASFGVTKAGKHAVLYTLRNRRGAVAKISDYGGIVTDLWMPDKNKKLSSVVLGFDDLGDYEAHSPYFGALIGRYGNRLAKGTFKVDGKTYHVPVNNGPNSLHGGLIGYDKRIWKAQQAMTPEGPSLRLSLRDPAGFQGFPGAVAVQVVYTLTNDNTLRIAYQARSTKATPINITNHSYFNLKDAGESSVEDHVVKLNCDRYTPVDATQIPTGEIAPVAGTPFDFRVAKTIGKDLAATGGSPDGYDHNFVVRGRAGSFRKAATVDEPESGRHLEVWTTEPGVQFYTGNFLDGSFSGRGGAKYDSHHAFCFECQHYPDSPNHKNFPNSILRPGTVYRQLTEYRFSAR